MSEGSPKLTQTTKEIMGQGMSNPTFGPAFAFQNLGQDARQLVGVTAFPASRVTSLPQMAIPNQGPFPTDQAQNFPQREKVAIVGTAPSSRMLAPFQDLTWDIWVCSPGNMDTCPRVDAWFEIHKNLHWPEYEQYGKNYLQWLARQTFPVYMQDQSYLPHAVKFPADELIKRFGDRFFGSTFAWMTALAIHKGYKEIGFFGVDMASKDEYIQQRGTFQFWFHKAEELGIKITIPPESDLLEPPTLYGYSDSTRFGRKMAARKQELLGRIAQIEQVELPKLRAQTKGMEDNVTYLKGAVEDLDYIMSIWPRAGHQMGDFSKNSEGDGIPPGK